MSEGTRKLFGTLHKLSNGRHYIEVPVTGDSKDLEGTLGLLDELRKAREITVDGEVYSYNRFKEKILNPAEAVYFSPLRIDQLLRDIL